MTHFSGCWPQARHLPTLAVPPVCPWIHRPMTTFCCTCEHTKVKPTHTHTQRFFFFFFSSNFPQVYKEHMINTRVQNVYKQSLPDVRYPIELENLQTAVETRWSSASCSCSGACLSSVTVRAQLHGEIVPVWSHMTKGSKCEVLCIKSVERQFCVGFWKQIKGKLETNPEFGIVHSFSSSSQMLPKTTKKKMPWERPAGLWVSHCL